MDLVDNPQNFKSLYGILEVLQGSHLECFLLTTLKLDCLALHSVTFRFTCSDLISNKYKKQQKQKKETRPSPLMFNCTGLLVVFG